jgi:hypothetical protein
MQVKVHPLSAFHKWSPIQQHILRTFTCKGICAVLLFLGSDSSFASEEIFGLRPGPGAGGLFCRLP